MGSNPTVLTDVVGGVVKVASLVVTQEVGVRVPAPQLENGKASQLAMAPASKAGEQQCLEGSTPSLSALQSRKRLCKCP